MPRRRIRLNAVQTLSLGFAAMILAGGVLLSLPLAARSGQAMPFLDALFTSASASCVTGLSLYDTYTQFSFFGQLVLMLLIQIGGLGFMSVSTVVAVLLHRRIGLRHRSILMDSVGALQVGGIVRLTQRALRITLVCEGGGAVLLALWFVPRYGWARGLWMGLFHAVSSYCNAGFDLLGTGSSLSMMAGDVLPNVVLMALVIAGGLGFLVWDDILTHGRHFARWRLHSKIVVCGTSALFILGAAGFYILEGGHAFAGAPASQKLLMACFQSVTCRTAGFATADLMKLSQSGVLLTMILMFVGAGSGSTGGGAKVNTVAVIVLCAMAQIGRKDDVNVFRRRLDEETIHRAYSSVSLFFLACLCGSMVLCLQGVSLDGALFESISAMGTVGLTLGVTPALPAFSKAAVIVMMFTGRVGSMSVAMAMTRNKPQPKLRSVPEKILIG